MAKHYVVLIALRGANSPKNEVIERALDISSADWLRFTRGQYLVRAEDPHAIYDKIKPILDTGDSILVLAVDLNGRQGWAPKLTIDWLNKYAP